MTKILTYKSDVDLDYPICRPSLDLDFTQEVLDNRITFTRGSTATRVNRNRLIESVAANQPRFDYDPVTGECKGLLIEESRQNLLTNSNTDVEFSNVARPNTWTSGQLAPDGSSTAKLCITNNRSFKEYITNSVNNVVSTFSIYLKTTGSIITRTFDLRDISSDTVRTTKTITITPNWQRFDITGTVQSNGIRVEITGGILNIFAWGAQLEAGAFPTSYIPTSASTVTRSADTANISGTNFSNFFNSTEGTLFVDSEMPYQTVNKFPAIGFSNGGGASNCIQFYYYNTSSPWVAWLVRNFADAAGGGTVAANLIEAPGFTNTPGVYKKLAGTYKFGEFNYYFDGKIVSRTTPNKRLPTVNLLEIGKNGSTVNRLNGHIRRITYYPIAITNTQMVNLTS